MLFFFYLSSSPSGALHVLSFQFRGAGDTLLHTARCNEEEEMLLGWSRRVKITGKGAERLLDFCSYSTGMRKCEQSLLLGSERQMSEEKKKKNKLRFALLILQHEELQNLCTHFSERVPAHQLQAAAPTWQCLRTVQHLVADMWRSEWEKAPLWWLCWGSFLLVHRSSGGKMFDYVVQKKKKKSQTWSLKKKPKKKNEPLVQNESETVIFCIFFFFSSRSGSQRWGPSAASSGQCADSLCGTRRRRCHTGSTAPCPAGAACIGGPRTVPPPPRSPPPLRRRRRRRTRRSWTRRSRRKWKRRMRRRERGGKAFEEEGVSWVVLVAYWKEKNRWDTKSWFSLLGQ